MRAPPAPMKHYARSRAWCEWPDFEQWAAAAAQALGDPDAAALSPFLLLSLPGISAAQQRACATRWMAARLLASAPDRAELAAEFAAQAAQAAEEAQALAIATAAASAAATAAALALVSSTATSTGAAAPVTLRLADAPIKKIRLGYLSCDFHQHATALLMVEMLEAHDGERFELHAYSYGADDGLGMRQRLQASFDHFHDISALSDKQAARAIHAHGIDILIDLKGYTAGTRTALLMYRPAPLQVSFLGYPGTLGGAWCDYLISDRFITPTSAAGDYSEALACLPHSYQPHGGPAQIGPAPTREQAGLPDLGLVLCCFNQAYKFTPEVFDIWCQLLDAHPGSVLWLLHNEQAQGNLRGEAMQRGIAPHRLVFAPDLPQAEHLARLQLADLVLDTSPYNAHTTASDALWAGVPLVTCAGDTFASRVAGSLLHAVGLAELVTHTLDDYADLAQALAADPGRLHTLRTKLAEQRELAPLFDVAAYTLSLEALYGAMWARHLAGLAPGAVGDGG